MWYVGSLTHPMEVDAMICSLYAFLDKREESYNMGRDFGSASSINTNDKILGAEGSQEMN